MKKRKWDIEIGPAELEAAKKDGLEIGGAEPEDSVEIGEAQMDVSKKRKGLGALGKKYANMIEAEVVEPKKKPFLDELGRANRDMATSKEPMLHKDTPDHRTSADTTKRDLEMETWRRKQLKRGQL